MSRKFVAGMELTPPVEVNDPQFWVNELNAGNPASVRPIFDLYYAEICHYVFSLTSNLETAKEITDDCFIKLWQARDKKPFAAPGNVKAFLYVVAKNMALTFNIAQGRRRETMTAYIRGLEDGPSAEEVQQTEFLWNDLITEVYKAVSQLAPVQRQVLQLYRRGLTTSEIAITLNIKTRTVINHRSAAISNLKRKLSHLAFGALIIGYHLTPFVDISEKKPTPFCGTLPHPAIIVEKN